MAARLGTINYEVTCGLSRAGATGSTSVSDPLIAALGDAPAWVVGGTVRDELLGRPVADVDVAVAGDPQTAARALARVLGGPVFPLSERFGAWRAIDRESGRSYDVSDASGRDDRGGPVPPRLQRERHGEAAWTGGSVIDPGGRPGRDLEARVLRVLSADAYEADPLRPLRLARLAAELSSRPTPRRSA